MDCFGTTANEYKTQQLVHDDQNMRCGFVEASWGDSPHTLQLTTCTNLKAFTGQGRGCSERAFQRPLLTALIRPITRASYVPTWLYPMPICDK
eukprot:1847731-Pleurochrysis_carterae.AAC.3